MADQATSNITASVFLDEVKSKMNGICDYTPKNTDDKWVFAEVATSNSATDLFDVNDSYFGSSTAVATADKVMWLAIKSLTTSSTEGVGISFDAGNSAYNDTDTLFISAGEMLIVKVPNCTVADLHVRSCRLDGDGIPDNQGTSTPTVHAAAILDDVA
jgi:hypothetical protein